MDDAYDHIATVRKNAAEEVRISLSEFHGTPLVDLRVFADFKGEGERQATRKGVSLKVERLPDLIEALDRALEEARRRGLVPGGRT